MDEIFYLHTKKSVIISLHIKIKNKKNVFKQVYCFQATAACNVSTSVYENNHLK